MKVSSIFMGIDDYFSVSPMSQRLELKPGDVYVGQITITNPASATRSANYVVEVAPYGVSGENYKADLVTQTGRTLLSNWVTIDEPIGTIEPNNVKKVNFVIAIPETAPGGGQYAAILVSQNYGSEASSDGVAVNNMLEVASLLYVNVDGETIHRGEILENNVPGFAAGAPITLGALLSNGGNVHEDAIFMIKVEDALTGEMIVEAEATKDYYTELVMPETMRYVQREIVDGLPMVGVVHVEQTIFYNGNKSEMARDVVICPMWFMMLIGIAMALFVMTIVWSVRRCYRKWKSAKLK